MFGDEQSNRRGETMLKTLGAQVKEYKKASIATPVFMILEVIMEMIIPLMMASIIDDGVEAGNLHHIYVMGAWMIVAALIGLFAGVMGGKYGANSTTSSPGASSAESSSHMAWQPDAVTITCSGSSARP